MIIYAMKVDKNGRSRPAMIDIALNPVSASESISARQDGVDCAVGLWPISADPRTSPDYVSTTVPGGGPYEVHVGGPPHLLGFMTGFAEITTQDGGTWRLAAGDFLYIAPAAIHHSNNPSTVPVTIVHLGLPGTPADTQDYVFK